MGEFEKADTRLLAYEKTCREIGNYEWLPIVIAHRGFIAMRRRSGNREKSIVQKAINMFFKRKYYEYIPDELCEFGHILALQNNMKESLAAINTGIKIARQKKLMNSMNDLIIEKLLLYVLSGKNYLALRGLQKIDQHIIAKNNFKGYLKLMFIKGVCLLPEDKKRGQRIINKALELAESRKFNVLHGDLVSMLGRVAGNQ
jgi:hypothetical protein